MDLSGRERREDASLGDLIGDLSSDMSTLVRKEMELARIEIRETAARAGRAGGMLGAGTLAAYLFLLLASFAAAWGLTEVMPEGWAFLIVAAVWGIAAAVLLPLGRRKLQDVEPKPDQTVETLKEDVQWARAQLK
ncbi:MAG TPA: phage holin family protein [Acidimicrobiia bacterium]|nr:phage holin family protein [Acidimicrobiia bacterium]